MNTLTASIHNTPAAQTLETTGAAIIRYGLAMVLLLVGAYKFAAYEAEGIQLYVSHSPLTSWLNQVLSVRGVGAMFGVIEITLGLLIAARRFAPLLSAVGSLGACVMFLTTLSFILTTPGVWATGYGFPFLSNTGQFLAKDLLLLGAAVWTAGEAWRAARDSAFRHSGG